MPDFLKGLPTWVQWILPLVLRIVTSYVLPAVAKAWPQEAGLINDLIAFLNGQPPSPSLRTAYNHYHDHARGA